MMLRIAAAAALVMAGLAQDPTVTLPDSYKVQFENAYARVVRVRYDAGAKLPEHTHPAGTAVYVYLTDTEANAVVFAHQEKGKNLRSVKRPAVKAGAVRISCCYEEHHTAENNSSTATEFLRILLKTDNGGSRSGRRIPLTEAEYKSKQIRITRIALEQHDEQTITAKEPTLLIEWPSGKEVWIDAGASHPIANHDARTVNFVRLDFLTKPQ